MREHMEPLGVLASIDIHLEDEGQVTDQVRSARRRAVIALETTAATVALYVSAQNLDRMSRIVAEVQTALTAGSTEPGLSLALVGRVA
jgi:hypothetical protein